MAAHRHGEDFDADIDNEYSYKMGVWCVKTAWAYWRQAPMVEFVNNRDETIANASSSSCRRHQPPGLRAPHAVRSISLQARHH